MYSITESNRKVPFDIHKLPNSRTGSVDAAVDGLFGERPTLSSLREALHLLHEVAQAELRHG